MQTSKFKTMRILYSLVLVLLLNTSKAQIFIQQGANLYLAENSSINVQGDLNSLENIAGTGRIGLEGDSVQWINFNGYTLPQLEIDNASGVKMGGPLSILTKLHLKNGRLTLNGYKLELSSVAVVTNENISAIETDGRGIVRKKIDNNLSNFVIPLVSEQNYSRIIISTAGKYSNGFINVSSIGEASPNKPPDVQEYISNYWKVDRSGIEGDVHVTIDYSKFNDRKSSTISLSGYYWNNNKWDPLNSSPNSQANSIKARITGNGGELFAMRTESLVLYPNPAIASTRLMIMSLNDDRASINILDSRGRVVIVQSVLLHRGLNHVNIDVSHLARGSYFIKFTRGDKQEILKFTRI